MGLTLVTAPTVLPVSYADAKAHLRLPDDTESVLVSALLDAARRKVEDDTGRALMTQTWDLTLDAFPRDGIAMPREPLASVTSVKVTGVAGVQSTLASTVYQVNLAACPPSITLADGQSWPSDLRANQAIVVRFVAGYGTKESDVPEPIRLAVLQLVAQWYAVRMAAGAPVPPPWMGYDALIAPYRVRWGIG